MHFLRVIKAHELRGKRLVGKKKEFLKGKLGKKRRKEKP